MMTHHLRIFTCALLLALGSEGRAPLHAQDAHSPQELLRRAASHLHAAPYIHYEAELLRIDAESTETLLSGRVLLQPTEERPAAPLPQMPNFVVVASAPNSDASYAMAHDGQALVVQDPTQQTLTRFANARERAMADGAGEIDFLYELDLMVSLPALHAQGEMTLFADSALTYEGAEAIAGRPCHVISVTYAVDTPRGPATKVRRWFIDTEDHWIRGVEENNGYRAILTHIDLPLSAGPAPFALQPGDNYTVRRYQKPEWGRKRRGLLSVGEEAPDWTLSDTRGTEHRLSDYAGRPVLLDFWATWCGPCHDVSRIFQELHVAFGDELMVLGIDVLEEGVARDVVDAYAEHNGLTFPLLLEGTPVAETYGVSELPTYYIVGVDGRILFVGQGTSSTLQDDITGIIHQHLSRQK